MNEKQRVKQLLAGLFKSTFEGAGNNWVVLTIEPLHWLWAHWRLWSPTLTPAAILIGRRMLQHLEAFVRDSWKTWRRKRKKRIGL